MEQDIKNKQQIITALRRLSKILETTAIGVATNKTSKEDGNDLVVCIEQAIDIFNQRA